MVRFFFIALFLLLLIQAGRAQKGGEYTYSFLGLTNSARVAALGGDVVSLLDDDINTVFHNPALLTPGMHNNLSLNYVNYFAGVNYGYASYAYTLENIGNLAGGIHYINYGTFDQTDELGESLGTFRASEYALNLFYSRGFLDSALTTGINLKPIFSSLEQYTSFGLAHAPFRFTVTFQHLERWDLTYTVEEDDLSFSGDVDQKSGFDEFADNLMRHVILSTEFLIGKNFHIDVGYNYKRRKEMAVSAKPGMVGFSAGFGFRVSKFHFSFGRASYHLAGGTSHFSLTTNLSEFYR